MLGVLYLILCLLTGREIVEHFYFNRLKPDPENRIWTLLPASFGTGTLVLTWAVYFLSWLNESLSGSRHPLFGGNLIVMASAVLFLLAVSAPRIAGRHPAFRKSEEGKLIRKKRLFRKELILFLVLSAFLTWIFFYVFCIRDGYLYSGLTVFSDYAPHTSMIRSFSKGNNFPTQYPHFGGEDVKYHFMFQFLVGNLEYLGLRLDVAYNLISMFSLLGMLMLLYKLCTRIAGGFATGVLAIILFFFRSGLTFFRYIWEHWRMGDLWQTLSANTVFIGYTESENWGLWCFNVYLNQRHLAFGLLLVGLALWAFLDLLEDAGAHTERGLSWIGGRLFSEEAWGWKNPGTALLTGIILGLTSFWNGAAVIGGLLILAGFAVFSDHKADYVLMAAVTVLLSEIQVKLFMDGSATSFSLRWGLLSSDKSLPGVLWYLFQISGFFFLGMLILCLFLSRVQRMALLGFAVPLCFAFTVSLTRDITVNHKYVLISYAFLTIFWADAIRKVWRRGTFYKLAAVLLAAALTFTGIYDFIIIVRDNDSAHRIRADLEDPDAKWLEENLDSTDLVLTPLYSMNALTLSGIMMYCGWPYYAWSAGYDTDTRFHTAKEIYTSQDADEVRKLIADTGVTYLIYDEGEPSFDGEETQEETIRKLYPLAYSGENGRIRIYQTSETTGG